MRTSLFTPALCVVAALVALVLAGVPFPTHAQPIEFGQEISLQSDHGLFLVAESDGRLNADRDNPGAWERFHLTRVGVGTNQSIRFGDQVALRSTHGRFVVAESDGSAGADRAQVGSWETWTLVNPLDSDSTEIVQARELVALLSHHDTFLVAESDGRANANRAHLGPWETWRIGREWTDFYYDEASECTPGRCCPCPYRGRFDGANCFVARPPRGKTARLTDGEFVYDRPGDGRCPLGNADETHCRVGSNPAAPPPFTYAGGFYLSSLCSKEGELRVSVERVGHCAGPIGPPLCNHRLTRGDFQPWRDSGVPSHIQRNTQLGVVFGPAHKQAKRVALLMAGQQFDQVLQHIDPELGGGSRNHVTGQPSGFKEGWSFRQPRRTFTLEDRSISQELVKKEILDPEDSFLAVAFDARFNHKFTRENKDRIENAYFRWLRDKFDPQDVELVYLAGHSRGGCLAMRLARRFQKEMPHVPIVAQSFDGVCNRNQGELGITIPGRVKNPLTHDNSAFAWPTDFRREFQHQEESLALLQMVGGHEFIAGDLAVRAFSQKRADQSELDLCWYQQYWRDLSHDALGGPAIVQPALDHLDESLDRFAQGPQCPPVGRCVKDPIVIAPFECNDLSAGDCQAQTECRLNTACRHVTGSFTCGKIGNRSECERYSRWCRWRTRGRDRCVRHYRDTWGPFECNDLHASDCGNHRECGLRQECRRRTGSLTCSDLFTKESCKRYTRWCNWE